MQTLTPAHMASLMQLSGLKSFGDVSFTPNALPYLSSIRKLDNLFVNGVYRAPLLSAAPLVSYLANCLNLKIVMFSGFSLTRQDVTVLGTSIGPLLTALLFEFCTFETLQPLSISTTLTKLDFWCCSELHVSDMHLRKYPRSDVCQSRY